MAEFKRPVCEYPEPSDKCEGVAVVIMNMIDMDTHAINSYKVCGQCFLKAKLDSDIKKIKEANKRIEE